MEPFPRTCVGLSVLCVAAILVVTTAAPPHYAAAAAPQPSPACAEGPGAITDGVARLHMARWVEDLWPGSLWPPWFTCRLDQSNRRFLAGIGNVGRLLQGVYRVDLGRRAGEYAAVQLAQGLPSMEAVLPDRSGAPHLLFCLEDLHRGVWRHACELINLRGREYPVILYARATNSGGEGCLDPNNKENPPLRIAGVVAAHVTAPDKDGYRAIQLAIKEEDCTTHVRRTFTRIFQPAASGFAEVPSR